MTEKTAMRTLRKYQKKLKLQKTKIEFKVVKKFKDPKEAACSILRDKEKNIYIIQVCEESLKDKHLRDYIIHELLHILFWGAIKHKNIKKEHEAIDLLVPIIR